MEISPEKRLEILSKTEGAPVSKAPNGALAFDVEKARGLELTFRDKRNWLLGLMVSTFAMFSITDNAPLNIVMSTTLAYTIVKNFIPLFNGQFLSGELKRLPYQELRNLPIEGKYSIRNSSDHQKL